MNEVVIKSDVINDILVKIQDMSVMKQEDQKFLAEHKEHFYKVFDNTFMWRTDIQKKSIVSDQYHPTLHSKFHQAILEQKVQVEQSFYLAKEFEEKKMDLEDLLLDLDELNSASMAGKSKIQCDRHNLRVKRKELEISFKEFELKQAQNAMNFRMKEVKGWQKIQDELMKQMLDNGMSEEAIWNKEVGEVESMFFQFLTNLKGIDKTTDGAEYNNLIALAKFGVEQANEMGILEELVKRCNVEQLGALKFLGVIKEVQK